MFSGSSLICSYPVGNPSEDATTQCDVIEIFPIQVITMSSREDRETGDFEMISEGQSASQEISQEYRSYKKKMAPRKKNLQRESNYPSGMNRLIGRKGG